MLQPATITFLEQLAVNNNKPWFDEHKKEYEAAKKDYEQFITDILMSMKGIDPAFAEQKAKNCIFRIYRDVRFSKDKTPYKAHFGAFMSRGGRKFPGAGYYIHIEPGKNFIGGGLWMPDAPLLKAVRQEIDYNFDEFSGIVESKPFKKLFKQLSGEQLKTVPQGYTAENPPIDYLKMKSFTVGHNLPDKELSGKNFVAKCVDIFTVMKPLVDFLNRSLD